MSTEFDSLFKTHLSEHQDAIAKLSAMSDQIAPLAAAWLTALKDGKKIIFFGNGGSAADAQHLAAELVVRYRINRPAMAGLALTTDTSILTAHSNDFGYDTVFSRQIEALALARAFAKLGRPKDAIDAVMALRPSALEGKRLRWARHAWALHNLVGHPLLQLLVWLGQTKLGMAVHDGTVPRPRPACWSPIRPTA